MDNDAFYEGNQNGSSRSKINAGLTAVKDAASQATDFIKRQADRRTREIGGRLNAAADELEFTGDGMVGEGQELAATLARQLARLARRAGDYLEETDTSRMIDDAKEFARRQPWTVIAIGVVAGFALSRMVKHAFADDSRDRS